MRTLNVWESCFLSPMIQLLDSVNLTMPIALRSNHKLSTPCRDKYQSLAFEVNADIKAWDLEVCANNKAWILSF